MSGAIGGRGPTSVPVPLRVRGAGCSTLARGGRGRPAVRRGERGREQTLELARRTGGELGREAVLGAPVRTPARESRGVTEAQSLQPVVHHLADPFGTQRLPGRLLAPGGVAEASR